MSPPSPRAPAALLALVPGLAGVAAEGLGLEAIGWVVAGCALALVALHERLVAATPPGSAGRRSRRSPPRPSRRA